uniref:Transcription factor CBF/NF-Y/archaeal histone domain-containing protein n=1 Tax=Romanomermis culicivorax TaxID=13658 RepID=A0A915JWK3_ROMCU
MNTITNDEMKKLREWISKYLDGNKDFVTAWLSDVPDFICDQIDDTLTPERLKQLAEEDDRTVIEPADSASQIGSLGRKLSVIYNYFKKLEAIKGKPEANKASKLSSAKRKVVEEKSAEIKAKCRREAKTNNKKLKAVVSSTKTSVTPLERYRASQNRLVQSSLSIKEDIKIFDSDQISIYSLANQRIKEDSIVRGNFVSLESHGRSTQPFDVATQRSNAVDTKANDVGIKPCSSTYANNNKRDQTQKEHFPDNKEPKKCGRVIFLPSSCIKTIISKFAPDLADQQDTIDNVQAASIIYLEKIIRKAEELATKSGRDYVVSKDMNEVYKIEYGSKLNKSKMAKVLDSINC